MAQKIYQRGFTLIELIMVIVIMGVIGGMVSVFMKSPIDAYFASARRAALTDTADTVLRRVARDIRTAVPNSIRPSGSGSQCMEFIPTKTGGRYRAVTAGNSGDSLEFDVPLTSFNMLGDNTLAIGKQKIDKDDVIVISNMGNGISGMDAYDGINTATVDVLPARPASGPAAGYGFETQITIKNKQFSTLLNLEDHRFQVVPSKEQVVAYACTFAPSGSIDSNGDGTGTLVRYVNELKNVSTTSSCPTKVGTEAVLATQLSACSFEYTVGMQRNALVQMSLTLTRAHESVSLFHEVHMGITP